MKFEHEIISGSNDYGRRSFIEFMRKYGQNCKGSSWESQNLERLRHYTSSKKWGYTNEHATISMKDFLIKYGNKRISLKTIYSL